MRYLTPILLLLFTVLEVSGQSKPPRFRNISINEGLSQSSVVDIAIDKSGFVWMATQDGLNRFDGKEFISFQKNFDDITTPAASKLGRIFLSEDNEAWLITRGGKLEKLDLFTQSSYFPTVPGNRGTFPPAASAVYDNSGETWVGTPDNGVFVYRNNVPPLNITPGTSPLKIAGMNVQQIFRDSRMQYWILTNEGLTRINKDLTGFDHFLNTGERKLACSAIAENKDGSIWLGTFGKGLWIKSKEAANFSLFESYDGINSLTADLVIESILCDREGKIWIGTFGKGLFVVNPADSTIRHAMYKKEDPYSLGYNDVLVIKEDNQGGIWIGTDGGGISYFDNRLANFENFTRNNLPPAIPIEQVRAITADATGKIWIGTSNAGIAIIDKQPSSFPGFTKIGSLLVDDAGDTWIGTQEDGLAVVNGKNRKVIKRFLPGETIWCMLENSDAGVWIGTRNSGLYLIDKTKGIVKHFKTPAMADNNIRTLTKMPGDIICIGFEEKGLQYLHEQTYAISSAPPALQSLLRSVVIRSVCYQAPYLWIGSFGNGLIGYDARSGNTSILTEKHGLPNNTIYGIQPDNNQHLWLSTNKGLCRLSLPDDLGQINRASFSIYTIDDGIQANEFNTGAHYRSAVGKLFFGGINGLTVFDPTRIISNVQPVPTVITRVLADNSPLPTDTVITYKKILTLPYNKNSLSFNFAAMDVISVDKMNYSYQLIGLDKDWIDAGNRNYVAYTNLPSGEYTFRVKASRDYNNKNAAITTLKIIIEPPFWKKAWFILVCVFIFFSLLYAIYRYRISELIRIQKVRNSIATDLHDEIGSSLTNISILTELSKNNMDQNEEAASFLNRISEEVTSSGQALDDIVWSINSNNDSLEQMVARMRRYVAEMFDTTLESYSVHFDERFAHRKLNMEQRRDLFLLFKEVINNIVKHASAKNVTIRIWLEKSLVKMDIIDDGIGFETHQPSSRNGIRNLYSRAKKWGGKVEINSAPGKGTSIHVSLPVN